MSNFQLPYEGQIVTSVEAFKVAVMDGGGAALVGISLGVDDDGHGGNAVFAQTDIGVAIYARSDSGAGVQAEVGGDGTGVHAHSTNGRGLYGHSGGVGDGVYGGSVKGAGVFGEGVRCGVQGKSGTGPAVFGQQTAKGDGIQGRSVDGTGVAGISEHGNGVYGRSGTGYSGRFDGNVRITGRLECDGDIILKNADCAEEFEASGKTLPGSVVIVDRDGLVRETDEPYDSRVLGVVSGAGDYRPALVLDKHPVSERRTRVALIGKVFCKVDVAYGAIAPGDLITTSATPGHGMKSSERQRSAGAVIGKALGALDSGRGLVPMLVMLR